MDTATMIFLGTTHKIKEYQTLNLLYTHADRPKAIFDGPSLYTAMIVRKAKRFGEVPLGGIKNKGEMARDQMVGTANKAIDKLNDFGKIKTLNIIGHSRGGFTARLVGLKASSHPSLDINCLVFDPVNLSTLKDIGKYDVGCYNAYWQVVMEEKKFQTDLAVDSRGLNYKTIKMAGKHESLVDWADAGHVGYMIAYDFLHKYGTKMATSPWQSTGPQSFEFVAKYLWKYKRNSVPDFFEKMFRDNWPKLAWIKRRQEEGITDNKLKQTLGNNYQGYCIGLAKEMKRLKGFPKTKKWLSSVLLPYYFSP